MKTMTPRIISYFLCGMRHPNSGLSEDDLSRLTGTSSSASCGNNSSASSSSSAACIPSESVNGVHTPAHVDSYKSASLEIIKTPEKISLKNSINTQNSITTTQSTTTLTNKTYLPEIINPLEWQKSRKRKDRLDSTSSAILDRKLQRSNSEDLITPPVNNSNNPEEKKEISEEERTEKVVEKKQDENIYIENQLNQSVGKQQLFGGVDGGCGNGLNLSKPSDAIRRVSSEDFKKRSSSPTHLTKSQEDNNKIYRQVHSSENIHENNSSSWSHLQNVANKQSQQEQQQQQQQQQQHSQQQHNQQHQQSHQKEKPFSLECFIGSSYSCPTKDMTRRARQETSPARSHHLSPIRNNNNHNGNKYRDGDDSECEHERRRTSERFCKSRVPPGRKASGVTKKSQSSKYFPTKLNDENAYKYDLSALKYERRGFISKKVYQGDKSSNSSTPTSDHNDNNLIDFHEQQQQLEQQQKSADASPLSSGEVAVQDDKSSTNNLINPSNSTPTTPTDTTQSILKQKPRAHSVPPITSAQDALPWGRSVPEDQAPILSRRYATVRHHPGDNIDTAAKFSKVSPYPQQFHKQNSAAQQLVDELYDAIEPLNIYKGFSSLTSLRTSEVMAQVIPAMMNFQSPEERLTQVNKRMSVLKKKLAQLEQSFETRLGYRPSEAERLNDKQMKNVISELGKLRKERHELKSDPMAAMGLKVSGGDSSKKLEKMKITLLEIEENLATKRTESERAETLDLLNTDQLVQEKTAVQHGLLYFESLYGRPSTKDERDAARPLYDRYRQLKRMVSRTVLISGNSNAGIPELPTILENEAMVFESTPPQQYSANNSSSDSNNSPSDSLPPNSTSNSVASDDSTTTTTTTTTNPNPNPQKGRAFDRLPIDEVAYNRNVSPNRRLSASENIGLMSIDQLWIHLEKTSEEKKLLKRSIREYETAFEEQNGRKMLKSDRKIIEETYAQYKEKKAKARLLQALIKKQIQR